jgi:hypothetical protein
MIAANIRSLAFSAVGKALLMLYSRIGTGLSQPRKKTANNTVPANVAKHLQRIQADINWPNIDNLIR